MQGNNTIAEGVEDAAVPGTAASLEVLMPMRDLGRFWLYLTRAIALGFALYYFSAGYLGPGAPQFHRGFFLAGSGVLVFLLFSATAKGRKQKSVPFYDVLLAIAAAASFGYFIVGFEGIAGRAGAPNTLDTVMGGIAVLISLELTRRTTGWLLTIVGLVSILYVFYGQYAPGLLQHGGFSPERAIGAAYQSFNGIFGVVASAFADFVVIFVIFGTFLSKSGAARFFADVPFAVAGHKRGGPAKVAVIMSGIFGSVSGSAVANVMTTGTFTIPAMIRTGYRREFAGGVEAAAASGGGILPPVMGTGAFLIAEFSGVPYREIVIVSIVPALLYFAAVYFQVDLEALKHGLRGMKRSELPSLGKVLREGWYFTAPLIVIFTLIIRGSSPAAAGFWGIIATIVVGQIPFRGRRMTLRDTLEALWESTFNVLPVAALAGVLGIVIAVVNLTGLGLRFSDIVINASGGNLTILMIFLILAAWVLGAGLTVTSAYVILAILAVPALTDLGVPLLTAHLIIFWISQDVTPPVCVPAFAAASIAGGDMMKTGWEAWKLARGLYIAPFLMLYGNLIGGSLSQIAYTAAMGLIAIFLFAAASTGYLVVRLPWFLRLVLIGSTVLCITPSKPAHAVGIVIGVGVYLYQRRIARAAPSANLTDAAAAEGT